jgi:hypothetical protein
VDAARQDKSGEREEYKEGHENGVRNLFSLGADARRESDEIANEYGKSTRNPFRIDAVARAGTDRMW